MYVIERSIRDIRNCGLENTLKLIAHCRNGSDTMHFSNAVRWMLLSDIICMVTIPRYIAAFITYTLLVFARMSTV